MTQIDTKPVPTLEFYPDFPEEWTNLDQETRVSLRNFLERLQANPYDPGIIEPSQKFAEFYGTKVGSQIVYWKTARKKTEGSSDPLGSIYVLAVEPADRVT